MHCANEALPTSDFNPFRPTKSACLLILIIYSGLWVVRLFAAMGPMTVAMGKLFVTTVLPLEFLPTLYVTWFRSESCTPPAADIGG
jgi:hypothetical protein